MSRRTIQWIGAAAVAFGGVGAVSLVAMPGASAAAPLSISPNSGPPGTRVTITVTNCNQPKVGFSDRTITASITGTSYVIPSNASDVANFAVTCTPAGGSGATTSYTVPFAVTGTSSSTTVAGTTTPTTTGHTGTTPSTSGSSSGTGSGSQVSRIPSGPAQTGGGSAAGGPKLALAMGGGSVMLAGGALAAAAYRRRSGEALTR